MNHFEFWQWFSVNAAEFEARTNTRSVADSLYESLMHVDDRLSIEVSEPDASGVRDVIFSTNGCREMFESVAALVAASPKTVGWRFIALKPPRGFEFVYRQEGKSLTPSDWTFMPLRDEDGNLGIRVHVPGKHVTISDAVLQTVIETGIGERAFSEIQHLEYCQSRDSSGSWLGLSSLQAYLEWQRERTTHR
jgi:hypothetical protein